MKPSFRNALAPLAVVAALVAAGPAHAAKSKEWGRDFGRFAFSLAGGFQYWSLRDVERAINARAQEYAIDGYHLATDGFGANLAYSAGMEWRLNVRWFARLEADWTRFSVDGRDRQYLQTLGSNQTTPVSLDYVTRVETRPLLFAVGLGRSWRNESLRFAGTGNLIVAPTKLTDELTVYELETTTNSKIDATGTGFGGEFTFAADYFTDTDMNVYLEVFGRFGNANVSLDNPVYESTILPGTRRVGLGGAGLRLGFRWI